jgi:hypothetical protein
MAEECAEIIQAVNKALRFGPHDHDFNGDDKSMNRQQIVKKLNDLGGVKAKMRRIGMFTLDELVDSEAQAQKIKKIERFMNYSRMQGVLKSRRANGLHNRLRRKIFEWKRRYRTDEKKEIFKTEHRPYMSDFKIGSGI